MRSKESDKDMNHKGKGLWMGAGVIALAVIYSVLLFVLKKEFNMSAWILYAFTMLAFLCLFLQTVTVSYGKQLVAFSAATIMVTFVYWAIQFVFGGIVCMYFEILKQGMVLVAEMVLLVLYLVLLFAVNGAHGHAQRQEIADRNVVSHIRKWESDVRNLSDQQKNSKNKNRLNELADEIHYLDVFEHAELNAQDEKITEGIARIRYRLEDGNEEIDDLIVEVQNAVKERDRRAVVLKQ